MFQAWLVKIAKIAAHSAPSTRPGNRPRKNVTVNDRKPRIGTDCSTSRMRDQHHLGAPALGRDRRIGQREQQRGRQRQEHAQGSAQRVIGQVGIIEADRVTYRAAAAAPPCRASHARSARKIPKISESAITSHWLGSARRPSDVKATNFDAIEDPAEGRHDAARSRSYRMFDRDDKGVKVRPESRNSARFAKTRHPDRIELSRCE